MNFMAQERSHRKQVSLTSSFSLYPAFKEVEAKNLYSRIRKLYTRITERRSIPNKKGNHEKIERSFGINFSPAVTMKRQSQQEATFDS